MSDDDPVRAIAGNPWSAVFPIPAHTRLPDAIKAIVSDRLPGAKFRFSRTKRVIPCRLELGHLRDSNPWRDAEDIAASLGYQVFFDDNVCVLQKETDPDVWETR